MTTTESRSFRIPLERLPELEAAVAKLAKRATKLGLDAPTLVVVAADPFRIQGDEYDPTVVRLIEAVSVTLAHTQVALPGWTFVARVERADEANPGAGNILYPLPGASVAVDQRFATLPIGCDHCRAARRRNSSFVVLEEATGSQRQVGSSCLADYLGHVEAERLASWLEALAGVIAAFGAAEEEGEGGHGLRQEAGLDLESVLAATARCISALGWTSAAVSRVNHSRSTKDVVEVLMGQRRVRHGDPDVRRVEDAAPAVDGDEIGRAIEWAAGLVEVEVERSNYLLNLRTLATVGVVRHRALGLACSLLPTFRREVERQIQRNLDLRRTVTREPAHLGAIDQKLTVTGTLSGLSYHESDFGVRTRVQVTTAEGDQVIWWASRSIDEPAVGSAVDLSGTVRSHESYRGKKSTVLTRARLRALCSLAR